jgi:hypothetical protein
MSKHRTWARAGLAPRTVLWLLAACAALSACSNDRNDELPTESTLLGSVKSIGDRAAVAGAKIEVDGKSVTANESGWFVIPKLTSGDRALVKVSAPGHVPTQKVIALRKGQRTFLDARMFEEALAKSIDPAAGGEVSTGGGRVVIAAGSLQKKSGGAAKGMARVSLTIIDPTDREERLAMPGDLTGVQDGKVENLESFGMTYLSMLDADGDELTFADGKPAKLSIPVPDGFAGAPPTSMPFWRYDDAQGRWVDAGSAAYDDVTETYQAEIDRPAYWNADQTYATACWTGKVVSPEGEAAPAGIKVAAEGVSYVGQAETSTDEQGRFSVQVMASTSAKTARAQVYAQGGGLYAQTSPEATPSQLASTGKCTDIGEIKLAFPLAAVVLTWGKDPDDLDSHFTGPDGDDSRFEVYYGNRDVDIAFLDTDDTSSYGPEITSLLKAEPGEYVYSVLNYSGESSGKITESSAQITAVLPNETRTFDVADAQNMATGDSTVWRVFSFTIGAGGKIGAIKPINQIVDEEDDSFDP